MSIVVTKIKEILKESKMSVRELARRSEIAQTTMCRYLTTDTEIPVGKLESITKFDCCLFAWFCFPFCLCFYVIEYILVFSPSLYISTIIMQDENKNRRTEFFKATVF